MNKRFALWLGFAVAGACVLAPAGRPAAATHCPPAAPPGSTIHGGLIVDGPCVLTNVTVDGGITVTSTGGLELENATVNGGIVVNGGELDVGHVLNSSTPTFTPSTIHGGVTINGATDFDLDGALIDGNVKITGRVHAVPGICGSDLRGSLAITDVTLDPFGQILVGDPEGNEGFNCPGNAIHGSVSVSNSGAGASDIEFERNNIGGSVLIDGGRVELGHNAIGGSLLCSPGTVLVTSADSGGNTVQGNNTCPGS